MGFGGIGKECRDAVVGGLLFVLWDSYVHLLS